MPSMRGCSEQEQNCSKTPYGTYFYVFGRVMNSIINTELLERHGYEKKKSPVKVKKTIETEVNWIVLWVLVPGVKVRYRVRRVSAGSRL